MRYDFGISVPVTSCVTVGFYPFSISWPGWIWDRLLPGLPNGGPNLPTWLWGKPLSISGNVIAKLSQERPGMQGSLGAKGFCGIPPHAEKAKSVQNH